MSFTIKITGDWKTRSFRGRVPALLAFEVRRSLQDAGRELVEFLRTESLAIHWKHRYRKAWRFKTGTFSSAKAWTLTVRNAEKHAIFIEKGRRKGAKPPPVAAITEWVRDKLGPLASPWAVAQGISRRGIKPRPVMYKLTNIYKMRGIVEKHVEKAMSKALRRSLKE